MKLTFRLSGFPFRFEGLKSFINAEPCNLNTDLVAAEASLVTIVAPKDDGAGNQWLPAPYFFSLDDDR